MVSKILNGSKAWDCAYNVSVVATRHLMQWMKQVMWASTAVRAVARELVLNVILLGV
jgi:hypothetical protein